MDDELDRRKLGYYLKIRTKYLAKLLPNSFRNLVNKHRIKEAKKRMLDTRYQKYSLESIGLDVGFGNRWAFKRAFEQVEKMSPIEFKNSRK